MTTTVPSGQNTQSDFQRDGRSEGLVGMPVEILLEIFTYLYPLDLLGLARTSKASRNILMSKTSKSVWEHSFQNIYPPLPDCPDNLSAPAFVDKTFCPGCNKPVDAAITRLLCCTKELLESLTKWSQGKATEEHISDIYVRVGNNCNSVVEAFNPYQIDMQNLLSVPADLRDVLEQCLSHDASPANLETYLPTIRQVITNMLQGLRKKLKKYHLLHREPEIS